MLILLLPNFPGPLVVVVLGFVVVFVGVADADVGTGTPLTDVVVGTGGEETLVRPVPGESEVDEFSPLSSLPSFASTVPDADEVCS
jgi:hypothetical protein